MERKLNTKEAIAFLKGLGLPVNYSTFCTKRASGKGPKYYRFGKSYFYDKSDILTWIEEHKNR